MKKLRNLLLVLLVATLLFGTISGCNTYSGGSTSTPDQSTELRVPVRIMKTR